MEFRVDDITAKCPGCGGSQFETPDEEQSGPYMNYWCALCGNASRYFELMTQIGREVAARQKT